MEFPVNRQRPEHGQTGPLPLNSRVAQGGGQWGTDPPFRRHDGHINWLMSSLGEQSIACPTGLPHCCFVALLPRLCRLGK